MPPRALDLRPLSSRGLDSSGVAFILLEADVQIQAVPSSDESVRPRRGPLSPSSSEPRWLEWEWHGAPSRTPSAACRGPRGCLLFFAVVRAGRAAPARGPSSPPQPRPSFLGRGSPVHKARRSWARGQRSPFQLPRASLSANRVPGAAGGGALRGKALPSQKDVGVVRRGSHTRFRP